MKNKKLLWLPVVLLLTLTVLLAGVMTACRLGKQPDQEPTESLTQPEQTVPQPTEPEETQPVVPPETNPEETEATEPEETNASGGTGPSVNTGTGGGYNPGATDPETTEPEGEVTEPVIEVPPAGSEKNAYYENIQDGAGEFTTVNIPAGATVYYRIQSAGAYLRVAGDDVAVDYDGTTYEAQEGELEIQLPEDDSVPVRVTFTNNGTEDKNFPVAVVGLLGSKSNPILTESLDEIAVSLEQDDVDGLFYQWIADRDGMLKLWLESESNGDLNVFVNGEAVQLTRDNGGKLCVQVEQEDEILIQVLAQPDEEGNVPTMQAVLKGYVAQMVELTVRMLPFESQPVTVEAGESVYFTVNGGAGKYLQLQAENAQLYYGEETLLPDEAGMLSTSIAENAAVLEVCNTGDQKAEYTVKINYPLGNILNPQVLTQLGDEVAANTTAENGGHYYKYTAPSAGIVTFQVWTAPENPSAVTNIQLTNNTSGEAANLADSEGETVSVWVAEGDEISICVTVENIFGNSLDAQLGVMGNHFGTQENPIIVEYPGFTAEVPAGKTLYYQGYNLNGILFSMNAPDATVEHNGTQYTGEIAFTAVSQGREPAVFAITNNGTEDGQYEAVFTYPLGWAENPASLVLGTNTLTQPAAATDYHYTFTAPKAGKLSVIFDETAQWSYAVNNITQGVYGDTQWSDSDPLVNRTQIDVKKNDVIQIKVNTYDKDNMFETPAGTVVFEAEFVSGPTKITNLTNITTASLIPGEYAAYTGQFYGTILSISGASNTVVYYDGTAYKPDSAGRISIEFPESGTADLEILVHNAGTTNITRYLSFSTTDKGSEGNPDSMVIGTNSFTREESGSDFYYYTFTATARGTLIITFGGDVECMYFINNQVLGYSTSNNPYRLSVRAGQTITLAIRTYDPSKPTVAPAGTVEFTVEQR